MRQADVAAGGHIFMAESSLVACGHQRAIRRKYLSSPSLKNERRYFLYSTFGGSVVAPTRSGWRALWSGVWPLHLYSRRHIFMERHLWRNNGAVAAHITMVFTGDGTRHRHQTCSIAAILSK